MKSKYHFTSFIFAVCILLLISCDNEFLKQETLVGEPVADTIYFSDQISSIASTFNYPNGNQSKWRVFQFPSWMKVVPMEGHFIAGKSSFQLEQILNSVSIPYGFGQLPLIFEVEGIGLVEYPLMYLNAGHPVVTPSANYLNLNFETKGSFSITNNGGGYYIWNIVDKPSWITLTKGNGVLSMNSSEQINFDIMRNGLEKGENTGVIKLSGNSQNSPILEIKVVIQVADEIVLGTNYAIEGNVVDVEYCKTNDLLVIATTNPNRLYFTGKNRSMTRLDLDVVPVCLSISESGDFVALLSTNSELALMNTETQNITKTIATGILGSDVVLGGNDWAYISPKMDASYYLRCVNLKTGQSVNGNAWVRGITYMKKVPGKNTIIGTRVGWSPDGLLVLDISKGIVRDTINQYHMDTWKFWFSENGDRLFCGTYKIYATPVFDETLSFISSNPPTSRGELEFEPHSISSVEHCAASNELFVATKMWNTYGYPESIKMDVYDSNGLFKKRTFMVSYNQIPGTSQIVPTYDVPFQYTDKSGTTLFLIKVANHQNQKYWFLETIKLK